MSRAERKASSDTSRTRSQATHSCDTVDELVNKDERLLLKVIQTISTSSMSNSSGFPARGWLPSIVIESSVTSVTETLMT